MERKLILASASPRRREILEMAGYVFSVISPDAEEAMGGLSPASLTVENSVRKAEAALKIADGVIICADTVVVAGDAILGKPGNAENAARMLSALSGKSHSVITGYTVTDGEKSVSGYVETVVTMREIQDDEMNAYINVCRPFDKAGAYGIQEAAGMFVSRIDGDYYNVVGLPLSKISEILRAEFGICAFMK
ncbi:MAG: septum formation protein Maf [Ruminococcaceae bacterium]|nr:septum formation protein Maf [Oscillospiraceae bacterium]